MRFHYSWRGYNIVFMLMFKIYSHRMVSIICGICPFVGKYDFLFSFYPSILPLPFALSSHSWLNWLASIALIDLYRWRQIGFIVINKGGSFGGRTGDNSNGNYRLKAAEIGERYWLWLKIHSFWRYEPYFLLLSPQHTIQQLPCHKNALILIHNIVLPKHSPAQIYSNQFWPVNQPHNISGLEMSK